MRQGDLEAIAVAGGESARKLVVELLAAVKTLELKVQELEHRLNQNSNNSSKPPSSDPPLSRKAKRALARERAKRSTRKAGAQPGHEGHHRQMAAPEDVNERFEHLPECCLSCGEGFSGDEDLVGEPVIHQKWELPKIEPLIYEHRLWRVHCANCGKSQLAGLPEAVTPSAFGPRIEAHIATLAGVYRLSRSQITKVVEEMFGIPISTGAVDTTLMRMSAVLADPWKELQESVRSADLVHVDETGWRLKGDGQWLWLAATSLAACYRIDPSRSQRAAKELLGQDFGQIAVTDRYRGYVWLDALHRQLCWSHVIRQLVSLSERQGAPGKLGRRLLKAAREIFTYHRQYLEGSKDLAWLQAKLSPTQERIHQLLSQGTHCRHKKTARFCIGLLGDWDSLWLFCEVAGVPLTNNPAERALRHAVIMRKVQLGTQSQEGNRWIERICSVRETCRLQERSVLSYLVEAATARHNAQPVPSLVPP